MTMQRATVRLVSLFACLVFGFSLASWANLLFGFPRTALYIGVPLIALVLLAFIATLLNLIITASFFTAVDTTAAMSESSHQAVKV
jgi:hypothetical protein